MKPNLSRSEGIAYLTSLAKEDGLYVIYSDYLSSPAVTVFISEQGTVLKSFEFFHCGRNISSSIQKQLDKLPNKTLHIFSAGYFSYETRWKTLPDRLRTSLIDPQNKATIIPVTIERP